MEICLNTFICMNNDLYNLSDIIPSRCASASRYFNEL